MYDVTSSLSCLDLIATDELLAMLPGYRCTNAYHSQRNYMRDEHTFFPHSEAVH